MRQFTIRLHPEPDLLIQQRASSIEGAIKAAIHFHGREWKKYTNRHGGGMVTCTPRVCDATYDRLVFTPGLRHNGERIYRANPFEMIRAGEKTTTCRAPRLHREAADPGDLLEAAQGGMRSGLVIEIVEVDCIEPDDVEIETALADGFAGTEEGAALMRSFIGANGGGLDLFVFRLRPDLSNWPELAAGYASGALADIAPQGGAE